MTHSESSHTQFAPHLTRDQAETMALVAPETRVVHVNDRVEGAVYIGRAMSRQGLKASPFANPHKISDQASRTTVITLYEQFLVTNPHLWALLPDLRGKPLACWCHHDGEPVTSGNRCHGDVLANILKFHTDDELRAMAVQS